MSEQYGGDGFVSLEFYLRDKVDEARELSGMGDDFTEFVLKNGLQPETYARYRAFVERHRGGEE